MATTKKQIDKLLFLQGGKCFFCGLILSKEYRSVEHLLAYSLGGSNEVNNCVTCCWSLNSLFRNMTLKEKFQIVLNK